MVVKLKGLEDNFDDVTSEALLNVHLDKGFHLNEALEKSLYNFDLETPEGIDRLIQLLPILDEEIMHEVYQEVFPGYPVDTLAPRVARIELRGYLMDLLYEQQQRSDDIMDRDSEVVESEALSGADEADSDESMAGAATE